MHDTSPKLAYPWKIRPEPGVAANVLPGVGWACMPLPFALDHVNVWLLNDEDKLFAIDTGIASVQTRKCWETLLSGSAAPLSRLLVTHYHPDHIGLSGGLSKDSMPVITTRKEWLMAAEARAAVDEQFSSNQDSWFQLHGLDRQRRNYMAAAGNTYRPLVGTLPENPEFIEHGAELSINGNRWQVITVGGHAPEMICLHCEELNVLISADHVLPSITPNISLSFYSIDDNPLASFLNDLQKFDQLRDDILVLPSHGLPFRGLHARVNQIIDHHDRQFDMLLSHGKSPRSAADMLAVLFSNNLPDEQLMFALGESIAHLHYLHTKGLMSVDEKEGVRRYISV